MTFGIGLGQPVNRAEKPQLSEQKKEITDNKTNIIGPETTNNSISAKEENETLNTGLTIENFKESMEKECECPFEKIEKSILEKKFSLILANMSDEEKVSKLHNILNDFKTTPYLIKVFFESFKDKEKAKACADSIDVNTLFGLNDDVQKEVVKHMSAPGTQKLFNEYKEEVYNFYHEHQELIDRVYKNNLSEDERQNLIDSLSEDEKSIIKQYCELVQIGVNITQSAACNENLSQEEKEEFITQVNSFFNDLPNYNLFLEEMAKFISNDSNSLNIDKDKLTEILNKATENKFSEKLKDINEKSAIDKDTGMLKTTSVEKITESEEKIKEIKQAITETSAPQETTPEETKKEDIADTDIVDYETITGNGNIEVIKDVFTGKIKTSEYIKKTAIKQYKLMDAAIQGDMLLAASGKFFNDLVKNTKSSTLENLLAIGWKGKSYDATQQVINEAEERKDDVA